MDKTHVQDRLILFGVVAAFAYLMVEAITRNLMDEQTAFKKWRADFTNRYAGHRPWLRDALIREEQMVSRITAPEDDCGCD